MTDAPRTATTTPPVTTPPVTTLPVTTPAPRASVLIGNDDVARCAWVGQDTEYQRYHDEEWGRPLHDEQRLFEKLCLEGFQAGLSWITILRRRPAFRAAFHDFDMATVAAMDEADVSRLLQDARIIRHRGKIQATISNARLTLGLADTLGESLGALIWSYAPPARPSRPHTLADVPAITPESTALSVRLRSAGYRFVGPTTMYALMQSSGLVDDHVTGCHRAG